MGILDHIKETIIDACFEHGNYITGIQPRPVYEKVLFINCDFHPNVGDRITFVDCAFIGCTGLVKMG